MSSIAFITNVDDNRQWLKAWIGLDPSEVDREFSVCEYVHKTKNALLVEDLQTDSRFPFEQGTSGIRFYFGLPIVCPEGFILGTLCVADQKPRTISQGYTECVIGSNSQDCLLHLLASIQNMKNRIAKIVKGIKLFLRNAKIEELYIDCHSSEIIQVLLNLINNTKDAVAKVQDEGFISRNLSLSITQVTSF